MIENGLLDVDALRAEIMRLLETPTVSNLIAVQQLCYTAVDHMTECALDAQRTEHRAAVEAGFASLKDYVETWA